jgi:predicted metalloprotease with PDZ domain
LRAYSEQGRAIAFNYVGEAGWETDPATPARRITYRVRADHDMVDWGANAPGKDEVAARFDHTYFFAGHAFFLTDFSLPACPIEVNFDLPRDWVVTSPWPMQGRTATATGPSNLARNVFAMGTDAPSTAMRGGIEVQWLADSRVDSIEPRIADLMNTIPAAYTEFWGRAPVDRLTSFFIANPMSDGGAFENSFAMLIADPVSSADEISWSHTLGHEIQHVWLGANAISGESPDDIYWFTEGFADYLTIKLMRRAGLISEDRLAQRVANLLRRYELAKRLSPDVGLSEAGASKRANWELIYGGGALVAMLLDAELSARDPNAFRDLMREVLAQSDREYSQARLMETLDASSGGAASEIFGWVNSRPAFPEIRARLARAGLDVAYFGSDEVYVAFPTCEAQCCAPSFLAGPN